MAGRRVRAGGLGAPAAAIRQVHVALPIRMRRGTRHDEALEEGETAAGVVARFQPGGPVAGAGHREGGVSACDGDGVARLEFPVGLPPTQPVRGGARGRVPGGRNVQTVCRGTDFQVGHEARGDACGLFRAGAAADVVAALCPDQPPAVAVHGDVGVGVRDAGGVARLKAAVGTPPGQPVGVRVRHRVPGRQEFQAARNGDDDREVGRGLGIRGGPGDGDGVRGGRGPGFPGHGDPEVPGYRLALLEGEGGIAPPGHPLAAQVDLPVVGRALVLRGVGDVRAQGHGLMHQGTGRAGRYGNAQRRWVGRRLHLHLLRDGRPAAGVVAALQPDHPLPVAGHGDGCAVGGDGGGVVRLVRAVGLFPGHLVGVGVLQGVPGGGQVQLARRGAHGEAGRAARRALLPLGSRFHLHLMRDRRPAAGVVAAHQPHHPLPVIGHGDGRAVGGDGSCVGRLVRAVGLFPGQLVGSCAGQGVPGGGEVQFAPRGADRQVGWGARRDAHGLLHGGAAARAVAGLQPHLPLSVARHRDGRAGVGYGSCVGRLELPAGRTPAQLVGGRSLHRIPRRRDVQLPRHGTEYKALRLARRLQQVQLHGLPAEVGSGVPATGPLQRRMAVSGIVVGVVHGHRLILRQSRRQRQRHHLPALLVHRYPAHSDGSIRPVPVDHVHRELARSRSRVILHRPVEGQLDGLLAGRGAHHLRVALPQEDEVPLHRRRQAAGVRGRQRHRQQRTVRQRRRDRLPVGLGFGYEEQDVGLLATGGGDRQPDFESIHQLALVWGDGGRVGQFVAVGVGEDALEHLGDDEAPGRSARLDEPVVMLGLRVHHRRTVRFRHGCGRRFGCRGRFRC